ncbi:MAG: peptide-methionine (R)-S-oxide reductase [Solirubrobacteraceae bacterium]|nr:peptide-methionine (R)-S-oxide reductase [Solirubrobacteraceae bacterium]
MHGGKVSSRADGETSGAGARNVSDIRVDRSDMEKTEKVVKSEQEWRAELDADQFAVLRNAATEPPFAGRYVQEKGDGVYRCAGCGNELFSSETKFESGTGWPSFTDPVFGDAVETREDRSHGMLRTEVVCARCDGHLGHLFDDGPGASGQRWCMNSCAMEFHPTGDAS